MLYLIINNVIKKHNLKKYFFLIFKNFLISNVLNNSRHWKSTPWNILCQKYWSLITFSFRLLIKFCWNINFLPLIKLRYKKARLEKIFFFWFLKTFWYQMFWIIPAIENLLLFVKIYWSWIIIIIKLFIKFCWNSNVLPPYK